MRMSACLVPWEAREGHWVPWDWSYRCCEPLCGFWKSNSNSPKEHQVLLSLRHLSNPILVLFPIYLPVSCFAASPRQWPAGTAYLRIGKQTSYRFAVWTTLLKFRAPQSTHKESMALLVLCACLIRLEGVTLMAPNGGPGTRQGKTSPINRKAWEGMSAPGVPSLMWPCWCLAQVCPAHTLSSCARQYW